MKRFLLLFLVMMAGCRTIWGQSYTPGQIQESAGPTLSIRAVIAQALVGNAQLREASENYRLTFAKYLMYRGQFSPALIGEGLWSAGASSTPEWSAGLSWTLPWGWTISPGFSSSAVDPTRTAGTVVLEVPLLAKTPDYYANLERYYSSDLAQARATYLATQAQVVAQVGASYWTWAESLQKVKVWQLILSERQDMVADITRLVSLQARASADILLAKVEAAQAHLGSLDAQKLAVETAEALGLLIGQPIEPGVKPDAFPTTWLAEGAVWGESVVLTRQEYRALSAYAESQIGLAKSQSLQEDPMVSAKGGVLSDSGTSYLYGLEFSWPFFGNRKAGAEQTQSVITAQLNRRLALLRQMILSQCRVAQAQLKTQWESFQVTRELERDRLQIFFNEERKMRSGLSSLVDVLIEEQALENVRFQRLHAQKDYAVAMVQWGLTTGKLVDSTGQISWKYVIGDPFDRQ